MISAEKLSENLHVVRAKIEKAARQDGRSAEDVRIVAVTKTWPVEVLRLACAAGLKDIGENYVQEVLPKKDALSDLPIQWHFIGHLQSNKVRQIANKFKWIHSIDRISLAEEASKKSSRTQRILIEVNFAGEASKSGVKPAQVPHLLEAIQKLPRLQIDGIMTMPPLEFTVAQLQGLYAEVRRQHASWRSLVSADHPFNELSMGTSHDYATAIENGATMVRLGSVLFGERTSR